MTFKTATLPELTDVWRDHEIEYGPSVFALVLCGASGHIDRDLFYFMTKCAEQLDAMSGHYTSLTLIAWELDRALDSLTSKAIESREDDGDLAYLHGIPSWKLNAEDVYHLAHKLGLDLNKMPFVLIAESTTSPTTLLAVSVRDWVASKESDDLEPSIIDFFEVLLTACRASAEIAPDKRLRFIDKQLRKAVRIRASTAFSKIISMGMLSQIIEGILKGMSS
jgi:hypothetical protein